MARWYLRFGRTAKGRRIFAHALALVENEGHLDTPELNRVLDRYAAGYDRRFPLEAAQLRALAHRIRRTHPDLFEPDGSDIPWWRQEHFARSLPALPHLVRPTREPSSSGCLGVLVGTLALGPLGWAAWSMGGPGWAAAGMGATLCGMLAQRWRRAAIRARREGCWCRLGQEGIECQEPGRLHRFAWSEVRQVWTSWVSGPGEDTLPAVVVEGPGSSFRLDAYYYEEAQIRLVDGVAKLLAWRAGVRAQSLTP